MYEKLDLHKSKPRTLENIQEEYSLAIEEHEEEQD